MRIFFSSLNVKLQEMKNLRLLLFTIIVLLTHNLFAQDSWYVSVNGSDQSGDGSFESPLRTIQYAIESSTTGDTVFVMPGNYQENLFVDQTKLELFIISTDGPENTSVTNGPGYSILINTVGDWNEHPQVHIKGFEFFPSGDGVTMVSSWLSKTYVENIIGHGFDFAFGCNASDFEVKNSIFFNNTIYAWIWNGGLEPLGKTSQSVIIAEGLLAFTDSNIYSFEFTNTIIARKSDSPQTVYYFNSFLKPILNNVMIDQEVDADPASIYTLIESAESVGFVDLDNFNFLLRDDSPAIGAGVMFEGLPPTDFNGNPRPNPAGSNPDIGAYEHILGSPVPRKVVLESPVNETFNVLIDPLLQWQVMNNTDDYTVQVSIDPLFSNVLVNLENVESTSIVIEGLSYSQSYFWRVHANNQSGSGDWSEIWSFATLAPPVQPVLWDPINESINLSISPELSWFPTSMSQTYGIQVSSDEGFLVNEFEIEGIETSNYSVPDLEYSTTYFWRINATNEAGTSGWSVAWRFSTVDYFDMVVPSGVSYCEGGMVSLDVILNAEFDESNLFTVQLSDLQGNFETPATLLELQTNLSFDAEVALPDTITLGATYFIRVKSTNPEAYSEAFPVTFYGYPAADFEVNPGELCWGDVAEVVYLGSAGEDAVFDWDFDGGNVLNGQDDGPYLVNWETDGNKNIFLVVEENGCSMENSASLFVAPQTESIPICMITLSESNKNMILWEQVANHPYLNIAIYKETSQSEIYSLIGTHGASGPCFFVDENSNPAQNSSRYKISVIDTCGYETPMSSFHKSMHLTINAGISGAWNLIWDKYEGFNYSTFNIYRGSSEGELSLIAELPSSSFTYSDQTPPTGTVFYQIEVLNPNPCDVNVDKSNQEMFSSSRSNLVNSQQASSVEGQGIDRLVVWPNPTNGVICLQGNFAPDKREIEILSINGKVLKRYVMQSDENEIDFSDLPEGIYILSVLSSRQKHYKKIVKL